MSFPAVTFPEYALPDTPQAEASARAYVLRNILGEFNHAVNYEAVNPEKDIGIYREMLAQSDQSSQRNRLLANIAACSFRLAICHYLRALEALKLSQNDSEERSIADAWLQQFREHCDKIWLEAGRRDHGVLHAVADEVHTVMNANFSIVIDTWKRRTEDAIFCMRSVYKTISPLLQNSHALHREFDQLLDNSIATAMARRGSDEYTRVNFLRQHYRHEITKPLDELTSSEHYPAAQKQTARLIRQAAGAISWMGRWGRSDPSQLNDIINKISNLSISIERPPL